MLGDGRRDEIDDRAQPDERHRFAARAGRQQAVAMKVRHRPRIARAKFGGKKSEEEAVELLVARSHARAGAITRFASATAIRARSRRTSAARTRRPKGRSR